MGRGWLDGPLPLDGGGQPVTGLDPQMVNPAFRFGARQGEKLRAVDDLKRSPANRAAAVQTPVDLPTWGHFTTIFRQLQGAGIPECLAAATADHRGERKQ